MQVQIDKGFASMKQCIGCQFVTLNDNVHRFSGTNVHCFGGTTQGGFARQDPVQAANQQAAANEPPLPPDLPVGVDSPGSNSRASSQPSHT